MPQDGRALIARVDLGRLIQNLKAMRKASKGLGILAVVKADAYGHGAVQVARALESSGIEGFCVATLPEALELRRTGISSPILVLESIRPESLPVASANAIDLTVVSADHLLELAELVPQHPVGLHLKLDTGMGRSGVLISELGECLDTIRRLQPWLRGAMAQFATADAPDSSFAHQQRSRFLAGLAQLRNAGISVPQVHHANSAGCLRGFTEGDTHVRCGISLYGLSELDEARHAGLLPILDLSAEVFRAVRIPTGTTVGYGCTYVAPQPLKLVTLNCGYADGYSRALANRAWAGYRGLTYPVVGQVSMDSLTVAVPESIDIRPGDSMVLLSREPSDPHSVANTARLLGTIPYEVTCALNRRVVRTHT
jgi:alanine racemase